MTARSRIIHYFNITHGRAERGSIEHERPKVVEEWQEISHKIACLDPRPVKMYNDSMCVPSSGLTVIPPVLVPSALAGMPECFNKSALLTLAELGCSLVPCESQEMFTLQSRMEEGFCERENSGENIPVEERKPFFQLGFLRSEFIVKMINESLKPRETGVLFLGHVHNFDDYTVNCLKRCQIQVLVQNECKCTRDNLRGFL